MMKVSDIKKLKPMLKLVVVALIGAVLASFGLTISEDKIDQAVETVLETKEVTTEITLNESTSYEVLSVIDGDTIVVAINGDKDTVRILGINTPETKTAPQGEECFGAEASTEAKRLLQGALVTLETDSSQDTRDKYNRLLAYVGLPDGRDFGQVLVADGFAYEYTYLGKKYKNQTQYQQAEAVAKAGKAGLWGVCQNQ